MTTSPDWPLCARNFPKAHVHSNSKTAPQQRNRANDFVHLGSLRITNRETPGHAEEGVTYIVGNWPDDAPHAAIVGDAIFAGLPIGTGFISWDLAKQKVREQILSLPPDTLICPGHGPLTTVAEEKAHNPFFSLTERARNSRGRDGALRRPRRVQQWRKR